MPSDKLRQIQQQLRANSAILMDAADERKSARFHRNLSLRLAFVAAVAGLEMATSHIKPPGPLLGLLLTFTSVAGGAWLWSKANGCVKACNETLSNLHRESGLLAKQLRIEAFK